MYRFARLSSTTLLAFVFLYSAVYFVQVYRLLPDDAHAKADPYDGGNDQEAKFSDAVVSSLHSRDAEANQARQEIQTVFGINLSAGQLAPDSLTLHLKGRGLTFTTWFKSKRHHASVQCIASFGRLWTLVLRPDGCMAFVVRSGRHKAIEYTTLSKVAPMAWTHITVSYAESHVEGSSFIYANNISIYVNGTHSPFFTSKNQELAPIKVFKHAQFHLATCAGFNETYGSQWIGRLADSTVIGRVVSPSEVRDLRMERTASDAAYILSPSSVPSAVLMNVPRWPIHEIFEHYSPDKVCSLPSPNSLAFYRVPKPSSVTAMAWIQLLDAPRHKESCILSQGSWEKGWKFSLTPQLNLQFSAHTVDGNVFEFFSRRMESYGDWQHVAVAYSAEIPSVQFYINGFPVEHGTPAEVLVGKNHSLLPEPTAFTVGRCSAEHENDEKLLGSIADVALWSQALDFLAVRMILNRGLPSAHSILQQHDPALAVHFAIPGIGCPFRSVSSPTFSEGWKPMPVPPSTTRLAGARQLLADLVIVTAPTARVRSAFRTLQFIDAEISLILKTVQLQVHVAVLATINATIPQPTTFRHLNVSIHRSHIPPGGLRGVLQVVAAAATQYSAGWVLIVSDGLSPMEYWLWNLIASVQDRNPRVKAAKALTLNHAGNIKSAGLQHHLTVVGDGRILKLPYMMYRGYPVNYLAGVLDLLQSKVEATSCESLLVSRDELLAGASKVPKDMDFFFQCGIFTAPLMRADQLQMAWNSWVLDQTVPGDSWNPNSESMLHFFEHKKKSAELYSSAIEKFLPQTMVDEQGSNLTVKWMLACGGSWAWEAANMIEHLTRKVQLRVQIQKPFQYCDGHNVLGSAAPSFSEQIERMMHLPSLRINSSLQSLKEEFLQDDVVIFHRDYFRVSNWMNPLIKRPRYLIGRYMNEVTSLHARLVQQCNLLDEVWVPAKHHVEIFAKAGVNRSKLVVMPEALDTNFFDPNKVQPLPLPGRKSFVFLSNFKFEERKNWKALIWFVDQATSINTKAVFGESHPLEVLRRRAFCDAFSSQDDVSLYIHTNLHGRFDKMAIIMETIQSFIDLAVIGQTTHKDNSTIPHIALTGRPLSTGDMMSLYKASNAFVLPTHGEGWGLPLHEAMAMALPTISTAWGGNTQFMTPRNSYLIQVNEFEPTDPYDDWLRNMKWAKPDERHLSKLMRDVFDNPDKAKAKGVIARQDVVSLYSNEAVAKRILQQLHRIEQQLASSTVRALPAHGHEFQWTLAADMKVCSSLSSMKRGTTRRSIASNYSPAGAAGAIYDNRNMTANSSADPPSDVPSFCMSHLSVKIAYVTPFLPRNDGLSQYAAHLRSSLLSQCASLKVDIFAVVLDFWNTENEEYDESLVKAKICRESYSDYEAAAALINEQYDAVILNMKLGTLGGTQCAYAACFAKLLTKPLITIVHSLTHNVDDAFQAAMLHTLAESDAAVVFSERGRIELDTALGFLPSDTNPLKSSGIHVVPHGATLLPSFPDKENKKAVLGLKGKTVLLTLGYQGPHKGIDHAMRGIALLPEPVRAEMIYLVVGQPADCGQPCVDHHANVEELATELKLRDEVLLIGEHLSEDAFETVLQAADIYIAIYPEDLYPYPATFYEAMAHGCALLTTGFKAALSHMPNAAGRLVWDRAPEVVGRQLLSMVENRQQLRRMQLAAWQASKNFGWQKAATSLLHNLVAPFLQHQQL